MIAQLKMKNDDYQLFLYRTDKDGMRNLPDLYFGGLYRRMKEEGSVHKVFYDGSVQCLADFVKFCKSHVNSFYVLFHGEVKDGNEAGIIWLNGFSFNQRRAYIHFCLFKKLWGNGSIEAIRWSLAELLGLEYEQEPIFDLLIGFMPVNNRLAIKFSEKVGMITLGILPNAIYDYYEQKRVDAVLTYATRIKEN
jgi:RimJ/RimL family protein N-acetyltransferase